MIWGYPDFGKLPYGNNEHEGKTQQLKGRHRISKMLRPSHVTALSKKPAKGFAPRSIPAEKWGIMHYNHVEAKFHPKFNSEVRHFNSTLLVSWKKILLWCFNPMPQKNEMSPKFEPQFHLNGTDTLHEEFEKAVRNDDQLFVQRLKNMWEYIGIPLTLESQIYYIKYSNMCGHWYANHL